MEVTTEKVASSARSAALRLHDSVLDAALRTNREKIFAVSVALGWTLAGCGRKPDGHENLGAGVEISGLSGELAVESGWRRRFTD